MENQPVEPLAVSVPEAASAIGLSIPHVWREIALGKIASVKVGRRRLIMLDDLREYLEARRSPARSPARGAEPEVEPSTTSLTAVEPSTISAPAVEPPTTGVPAVESPSPSLDERERLRARSKASHKPPCT